MRKRIKSLLESITQFSEINTPNDDWWADAATSFFVGKSKLYLVNVHIEGGFGREVFIKSREQLDGTTAWVVLMDSWVLGKDNEYHYEPMPSSRTDKFIANTRFDTREEAMGALIIHENRPEPSKLRL
jgi:hypothetical protein